MDNPIVRQSHTPQSGSPTNSDLADLVGAILGHFFWPDLDARSRAVLRGSWIKTLSGVSIRELQGAWEYYQHHGPRDAKGALTKPVPIDLRNIVLTKLRPKPAAAIPDQREPEPEPERVPLTLEQRRAIVEANGWIMNEHGGIEIPIKRA